MILHNNDKGHKMTNDVETTHVQIPGTMSARVAHGRIIGFDFSPAAAYAGYFGAEISITEGPEIAAEAFWDMGANKLSVTPDMQSGVITASWIC
jgi:hypothetical protein